MRRCWNQVRQPAARARAAGYFETLSAQLHSVVRWVGVLTPQRSAKLVSLAGGARPGYKFHPSVDDVRLDT